MDREVVTMLRAIPEKSTQGTIGYLAVDVGYGYVKALSAVGRRVFFPSVVAPAPFDPLAGVLKGGEPGHRVTVRKVDDREKRQYLVGEAAMRSSLSVATLAREKPAESHDLLLLTAAYLAGACTAGFPAGSDAPALAVGLPLAFYKTQRKNLKARLERLGAWVAVDGGEERWIRFCRVVVLPQGAGVVMAQGTLNGLYGVVDIGQYTCDYLLVEGRNGALVPVPEYCSSLEAGVYLVHRAMAREFQHVTGVPLDAIEVPRVLDRALQGRPVVFDGRALDLTAAASRAVREAGQAIGQRVLAVWGPRKSLMEGVLLAGGGALLFREELMRLLPGAAVVSEPVFANCLGYLKVLQT